MSLADWLPPQYAEAANNDVVITAGSTTTALND
ncbi:hypothetical protein PEC302107_32810 [Pectobacterium araliae]|nr:hypothetical protein PEC302107_32810 [Pectobacterium carotovorum subsp. carotovorum]